MKTQEPAFRPRFAKLCALANLFAATALAPARADSSFGWLEDHGLRGFEDDVRCSILWDRDGPGGQPPVVVVGGRFSVAGETLAGHVALWNGAGWEALAQGVSGEVRSLAVLPNGDLVVGGNFNRAGDNLVANGVAAWDGEAWRSLAGGFTASATVEALAVLPNGDLLAAGSGLIRGGSNFRGVARWDGEAWHPLGAGLGGFGTGRAFATLPSGEVVLAGNFTSVDGVAASNIARFDGETWRALGAGVLNGQPHALAVLSDGRLVAAGEFNFAGEVSAPNIAIWDGIEWEPVGERLHGQFLNADIFALAVLPGDTIVAGGGFWTSTSAPANYTAFWDGSAWQPMGTGMDNHVYTLLALPDGGLLAGGRFRFADGVHAGRIARWDGDGWDFLGAGFGGTYTGSVLSDAIYDFLTLPNGDVIAAGTFWSAGHVSARSVARWNGQSWSPMGSGLDGTVYALARLPGGGIVAGGDFKKAGGADATGLAVWDGLDWEPFADPLDGLSTATVRALRLLPNGSLLVGGAFRVDAGDADAVNIALWDGASWSRLGPGLNLPVHALASLPDGSLVAGGEFTLAGSDARARVARWDGEAWRPMGAGANGTVYAFATLPDGDLLAGGRFATAGGVSSRGLARWDGESWSPFTPSGYSLTSTGIRAVMALPNGHVVIGGDLTLSGGQPGSNLAYWDGAAWSGLGSGAALGLTDSVYAFEPWGADGAFYVGGGFLSMDGKVSSHFARWGPLAVVSKPALQLAIQRAGDAWTLHAIAPDDTPFALQFSTDLATWQTLLSAQQGELDYTESDPARLAAPRLFYRALAD